MSPRQRAAIALGVAAPLLVIAVLRVQDQWEYNQIFCPGTPAECDKAFVVVSAWLALPPLLLVAALTFALFRSWAFPLLLFSTVEALGILVSRRLPEDFPGRWHLLLWVPSPLSYLAISVAVSLYAARRLSPRARVLAHIAGAGGAISAASILVTVAGWAFRGAVGSVPPALREMQRAFFGDLLFALVTFSMIPMAAWWPMPNHRDAWGEESPPSRP